MVGLPTSEKGRPAALTCFDRGSARLRRLIFRRVVAVPQLESLRNFNPSIMHSEMKSSSTGTRASETLAAVCFAATVVWSLYLLWRYAQIAPPSFDGAMNLNTARSFLHGDGYGFFYDRFFWFPAQTDGPFILPTALAFWIGGVTLFTSQVVNLLYVIALACATVLLLHLLRVSMWLALFVVAACMATPGFVDYAMNGYGEIPMLVWFLCGLIVLVPQRGDAPISDARLFFAGLLFGVSYLTKVVALVCIGPAMLAIGLMFITQPRNIRRLAALGVGFLLPVIAWEVFRFIEVGSARAYVDWWKYQLAQIRSQSGVKRAGPSLGFLGTGADHLRLLSEMVGVPSALLIVLIVAPVVVGGVLALAKSTVQRTRLVIGILSVVCGLYFFWWMFITPQAMTWLRRILAGLLLLQILLVADVAALAVRFREGAEATPERHLFIGVSALALLVAFVGQCVMIVSGQFLSRPPDVPGYARDMMRLADDVRALPQDATLFGTGWWQAPVIALFAQRRMMNLDHWSTRRINEVKNKYLITDMYTQGIAQSTVNALLDRSKYTKVKETQGGSIYRLDTVQPYLPFSAQDQDLAKLASGFDLSKGDYPQMRGFYAREREQEAWMAVDAAVLLKRSKEKSLRLVIEVPPELLKAVSARVPSIQLSSPGCLDRRVDLTQAGVQTIDVPLECEGSNEERPFPLTLTTSDHVPFIPQIDSDNRLRGVKLRSVQLD